MEAGQKSQNQIGQKSNFRSSFALSSKSSPASVLRGSGSFRAPQHSLSGSSGLSSWIRSTSSSIYAASISPISLDSGDFQQLRINLGTSKRQVSKGERSKLLSNVRSEGGGSLSLTPEALPAAPPAGTGFAWGSAGLTRIESAREVEKRSRGEKSRSARRDGSSFERLRSVHSKEITWRWFTQTGSFCSFKGDNDINAFRTKYPSLCMP